MRESFLQQLDQAISDSESSLQSLQQAIVSRNWDRVVRKGEQVSRNMGTLQQLSESAPEQLAAHPEYIDRFKHLSQLQRRCMRTLHMYMKGMVEDISSLDGGLKQLQLLSEELQSHSRS